MSRRMQTAVASRWRYIRYTGRHVPYLFLIASLKLMEERPVLWTNWPFVVAAATLTPDPSRSLEAWQKKEMREGAQPIPASEVGNVWSDR